MTRSCQGDDAHPCPICNTSA